MSEHYTGATQSKAAWCNDCQAHTQHRVEGHKLTNICIPCQEKAEIEYEERRHQPPAPKQQGLALNVFLDWETGRSHA